jgi:hypothetical protein
LLRKALLPRSTNLPKLSCNNIARPLATLKRDGPQNPEAGSDPDDICQHIVKAVFESLLAFETGSLATAFRTEELSWEVPLLQANQGIIEYTQKLEEICANLQAEQRATSLKFLIGCILLAGNKLPGTLFKTSNQTLDLVFDRTKHRRMKNRAAFACTVVDALLESWGECTYYICHTFAGKFTYLQVDEKLTA